MTATRAVAVLLLIAAGCASDGGEDRGAGGGPTTDGSEPRTIEVPADAATIQEAVDEASPGDLVLIAAGTYTGTVTVETPELTIRGVDRNDVVLDGEDTSENGIVVFSDGVTVENLSVHSFRGNGVFFSGDYAEVDPLSGFAVRFVTAYDNGLYGIYAFGARGGVIEQTYTSGHPDAGLYVGQCYPCDTVVRDNVAEFNQNGFEAANAGGHLYVVSSVFRHNRVGIQVFSSTRERLYPQREAVVMANLVTDNDGERAPSSTDAHGTGIAVAGGQGNRIEGNTVRGHSVAGIVVSDIEGFLAEFNRVIDNDVSANTVDLAYVNGDGATLANCFGANTFETSSPPDIEVALNCAPETTGGLGTLVVGPPPPAVDPSAVPPPPDQRSMADATTRGPARASADVPEIDEASLVVPTS